jgi:signal transduction histidine kinase
MRWNVSALRERLTGGSAERDPGFLAEIQQGSVLSLRTVGALEIAVPLLMLTVGLGVLPMPVTDRSSAVPNLLFAGLGAATFAAGFTPAGRRRARFATAASIGARVAIMIWSSLLLARDIPWVEHHLLGYIALVMFGAAAAVPLKPTQTFALGLSIAGLFLVSQFTAASNLAWRVPGYGIPQHFFTLTVTILCTALTASVYRQRRVGYRAHQEALRASEMLRETESKLLISENAGLMGRVAAGLSHELNSPIGALASAVESLSVAALRLPEATPAEREKLLALVADLSRSGRDSTQRLRGIVGRMQRFANLDRADVQSADLNTLICDVVALVGSQRGNEVSIITDLQPVPRCICRPQQISSVLSNLLGNALDATGQSGSVLISTRSLETHTEIKVEDNGRGIPAEDLAALFDPAAFRVDSGRVAAGNWSLFSCRQIVREHGGEIKIESAPGEGATVRVILPAGGQAAAKTPAPLQMAHADSELV